MNSTFLFLSFFEFGQSTVLDWHEKKETKHSVIVVLFIQDSRCGTIKVECESLVVFIPFFFFWARFIYFMCARRWNRGRTIWRVHGAEENRESNWRHWMKFHSKLNLVYMASFLSNSCSSSVNSWSWLESNDHLNVSTTGQSKNCCRETDVFVKEFGKNLAREILFLTFPRN